MDEIPVNLAFNILPANLFLCQSYIKPQSKAVPIAPIVMYANVPRSSPTERLIDKMVFYATFNSISFISKQQLTLFLSFLGFISTKLGL